MRKNIISPGASRGYFIYIKKSSLRELNEILFIFDFVSEHDARKNQGYAVGINYRIFVYKKSVNKPEQHPDNKESVHENGNIFCLLGLDGFYSLG
jgi:hypothetical protein